MKTQISYSFTIIFLLSILPFNSIGQEIVPTKKYTVKVKMLDGSKMKNGLFMAIKDSSIVIQYKRNQDISLRDLPYTSIKKIQIRRKGAKGKGALIAAGICTVYAISNRAQESDASDIENFDASPVVLPFILMPAGVICGGALSNQSFEINGSIEKFRFCKTEISTRITQ